MRLLLLQLLTALIIPLNLSMCQVQIVTDIAKSFPQPTVVTAFVCSDRGKDDDLVCLIFQRFILEGKELFQSLLDEGIVGNVRKIKSVLEEGLPRPVAPNSALFALDLDCKNVTQLLHQVEKNYSTTIN